MRAYMEVKGDYKKANSFLERLLRGVKLDSLNKYGERGVAALKSATPKDTGLTADSWTYEIVKSNNGKAVELRFNNSNVVNYVNIALILQYGHATRNGGYVKGIDYINPALRPVFEKLADDAWKELVE